MEQAENKPARMRNIGPVGMRWLASIGIHGLEELTAEGSVNVYLKLKEKYPQVNLTALYALEGAILDMHWNELPPELRDLLREQAGWQPPAGRVRAGGRRTRGTPHM